MFYRRSCVRTHDYDYLYDDDDYYYQAVSFLQATPPIPTHFSVMWSVCLSVVCHIREACLNPSTDLDAIWHLNPTIVGSSDTLW